MAKNPLHIKNTQLAEAINLSGLKAKLSRKKAGAQAEEPKGTETEEITFSTLKEVPSTKEPLHEPIPDSLVGSALEVAQEKTVVGEPSHEEPVVTSPKIEPMVVSPVVAEEKPIAVVEPSVEQREQIKAESVEKAIEEKVVRAPVELPAKSIQRPLAIEKKPTIDSRRSQGQPLKAPPRISREREKESIPPRPFTPTPVAPRPPPAPRSIPAPFISAARSNPDQLGPVIREPPAPKVRPKPLEPKERYRRDEQVGGERGVPREYPPYRSGERQPVRSEERPPYHSGERPPIRSGERPPYHSGERPPIRSGERPPYRSGERQPIRPGEHPPARPGERFHRPFEAGQRFDRSKPFERSLSAPRPFTKEGERPASTAWAPPAFDGDGERIVRRSEPSDKKIKTKSWDSKQKPVEIKGAKPGVQTFDIRSRRGLGGEDEESAAWRRRRPSKHKPSIEQLEISRPSTISVRLPISVKDLASEMKLKASQLISKLFLQGTVVTLNDLLSDETQVQLLGSELGCEIQIDTSEQERIRITDKSVMEEIALEQQEELLLRPPVVTFMGHVDHGKTSLIDTIRKSNRAAGEIGAITQHIGALTCSTDHGRITIIDTPGHEAFSAMRERGASITDIVVLVVAGDEGIKEQTLEAIKQAKDSKATIIVAINKCDKPAFDQERVFRQLSEVELLPEAWGGAVITVPCSALTGQGIHELLEMISLQSEVLELKANPAARARGTVIEAQMSKGLGLVATVLVQNGTLRQGDCLVFGSSWARIKSMRDDLGNEIFEAGPSVPARITGISDLPTAGEEFIVVKGEKEARNIAESRKESLRQQAFLTSRRVSLENMMEKASTGGTKKVLNIVLRADVQGSLEAMKTALQKIESNKVSVNVISYGVGEISESDVELAATSKATILGFHTGIEAHAEPMVKTYQVPVRLHSIIYHAQDDIRAIMKGLLDKVAEEQNRGQAEVKTLFKSSHLGTIAGCIVVDGTVSRNYTVRVVRDGKILWQGPIASLKRFKEDVKEVTKGTECGIVLQGFSEFAPGDILEVYEIVYHEQDL